MTRFRTLGILLGIIWSFYLLEVAGITRPPISISYIGTFALGLIVCLHVCVHMLKDYDIVEKKSEDD